MAAGSGGNTYGEWSQVTVDVNGIKVTLETDISEEKMVKKLRREGFTPIQASRDQGRPKARTLR
jgi:hypothetical protein